MCYRVESVTALYLLFTTQNNRIHIGFIFQGFNMHVGLHGDSIECSSYWTLLKLCSKFDHQSQAAQTLAKEI